MPRNNRINQSEYPYHVTSRTVNKQTFPIEESLLWELFSIRLHFAAFAFNLEIHSFVLMRNHYHLMIRTPNANLSQFMCYFNREMSKEFNGISGRINQTFGSRYYASIVKDPRYYLTLYRYVYRNPIEAGLCEKVEDYQYSSLQHVLGKVKMEFPVFDFPIVDAVYFKNLDWLNSSYKENEKAQIRKALKKPIFDL